MWSASDEALVAGMAVDDREAATAFVRRYQARVFGLAMAVVGDRDIAEDIAQETFLRAWRHAAAYDARRGRVSTWLLTIARNLTIDQLRVRHAQPIDPAVIGDRQRTLWATIDAANLDGELADLRDALAEVPAEQRRALLLAALWGFTAREIAELEAIPVGTAKTRIRAAMLKLREAPVEEGES